MLLNMSLHGSMIGNMLVKHATDKINASYLETEGGEETISNLNKTIQINASSHQQLFKKKGGLNAN